MNTALLLATAAGVLVAAWTDAFAAITPGPFSAHMSAHMAVVAVAAPLMATALAGGRWDPAAHAPRWFLPIPASMAELVLVWLWHVPALHHAARTQTSALIMEQASFLAAGLYLWIAATCGDGVRGSARGAAGIGGLLFTSMHMALLGVLFALAPRPLYAHQRVETAAALADQHVGGVIMLLAGGGSYLIGGLWLTRRVLDDQRAAAGASS